MRKIIIFYILLGLVSVSTLLAIEVSPSGTHYVGDLLTFTPSNPGFSYYKLVTWNFGDGTIQNASPGTASVTHRFSTAGTYTVTVNTTSTLLMTPLTESINVMISARIDNRSITVSPSIPKVGKTATFTALNFYTPNKIVWDMGDGTILGKIDQPRLKGSSKGLGVTDPADMRISGGSIVNHTYTKPGNYTVKAFDLKGNDKNPITLDITVNLPTRTIIASPSAPQVGDTVRFTAKNFLSTPIDWNFGDGQIQTSNGDTITHVFNRVGTYNVTARESNTNYTPVSITVRVTLPDRSISVSTPSPTAGMQVECVALGFLSDMIDWNWGDGTTTNGGGISESHTYDNPGTYTVTARESNTTYTPVSIVITVTAPNRQIRFQPSSPRVDQNVHVQADNFLTSSIDWDFGDGTKITGGGQAMVHRYMNQGSYTISAKDSSINHTPITTTINILEENRWITASPLEVRPDEVVTARAHNFRGDYILWDFGDGTQRSGFDTETHAYKNPGLFTITAFDENGGSQVPFSVEVKVIGITDKVNLQVAEISFDNGKYYKVIPKNSKNIRAVLRMKWGGTGVISGYWLWNNQVFEFFSEVVSQGMVKEIYTKNLPGIPTVEPGLHTISLRLTRPGNLNVVFPVIKYFVLSAENSVKTLSPKDAFIAKDNEIPEFSWEAPKGGSKYQIVFSNAIYPLLSLSSALNWIDTEKPLTYTPDTTTWNKIKRNCWTYWKVRALDTFGNVVAESDIHDIKVVIATAEVNINKVTDLEGGEIEFADDKIISDKENILAFGSIKYKGNSQYLVLRIYVDNEIIDQLLFRNVKKEEILFFETSVPNKRDKTNIMFKVLKTSSPAIVVGIKGITLKRQLKK